MKREMLDSAEVWEKILKPITETLKELLIYDLYKMGCHRFISQQC